MQSVIAVLLFSSALFARQELTTIKTIEQANQQLREMAVPTCETCGVGNAGKSEHLWQQCIREICPRDIGHFNRDALGAFFQVLSDPKEKAIIDSLESVYRAELEGEQLELQSALARIEEKKEFTQPQALQLLNIGAATLPMMALELDQNNNIDMAKSREKLKHLSEDEFQSAVGVYNVMKLAFHQEHTKLMNEEYEFYVQRYSSSEIQSHIGATLQLMKERSEFVKKEWGLNAKDLMDTAMLESDARLLKGEWSQEDLVNLKNDLDTLNVFYFAARDKSLMARLRGQSRDLDFVVSQFNLEDIKARLNSVNSFLKEPNAAESTKGRDDLKEIKSTCETAVKLAKQFYPSEKEVQDFKTRFQTYKSDFVSSLGKNMSSHSRGVLGGESKAWLAALPPTYDQFLADLSQSLRELETTTRKRIDYANALRAQNSELMDAVFVVSMGGRSNITPLGQSIKEICEKKTVDPISDKAWLGKDKMVVGPVSVRNPPFGDGTTKHELAHLTSGLFENGKMSSQSKNWYDGIRTCLREPKGNDQYVEEDWADFAATLAGAPTSNCYYLGTEEADFTLQDDVGESHSSTLYRVLHKTMLTQKKIPAVCTEALAAKGQSFQMRDCRAPSTPSSGVQ